MKPRKVRGFDPLLVNHVRESLGGGIHQDTIRDKRGLHDEPSTRHKSWSTCRRFMCVHPTQSGKPEKDPEQRLCRFHSPEAVRIRLQELQRGKIRTAPCSGSVKRCLPGQVRSSSEAGACVPALGDCTFLLRTCQTSADWFYVHGDGRSIGRCRFTTARWKRKSVPWKAGDPAPPGVWDDEEGDDDDVG